MYLQLGMLVSFASVLGLSILGLLLKKDKTNIVGTLVSSAFLSFFYGLILWWVYWSIQAGVYGPTPFFWSIIIGAVIGGIVSGFEGEFDNFDFSATLPAVLVIVGYVLYVVFVLASQSDMFQSQGKVNLAGKVDIVSNLNEVIKPADTKHIIQVPEEIATTFAQAALSELKLKDGVVPGSRYSIGKPTQEFVDMQIWYIFPLEFQDYQKWSQDPQVPGYIRVSAENPFALAQVVQYDKNGKEIHIKYLNSACFDFQAERYLRSNGYLNAILDDWTYELDDDWKPYYTVSVLERKFGYEGYVAVGTVLLDLQSGDKKFYKIGEEPKWVDRVIPLEKVIDQNSKSWGEYSNCDYWYAAWHNDKSQKPTEGWYLTYSGSDCQWFTGFTSMNDKDSALTGFMVIDAKTGKSKFLKVSGVTENLAMDAAKGMWANYPSYETTVLVPYNIYGIITYVIPMKSTNQFVGISLVSVDVKIKAYGKTLEEALRNYRDAIVAARGTGLAPESGKAKTVEIKGVIERIGLPLVSSKSTIFTFKLVGVGKIFQVGYSDANPESLIMKEGDKVVLTYEDTTEIAVNVSSFDISSVSLETGSVTQAKYVDNQKVINKETSRISDQKKVDDLIGSDQMKKVDPEALQKFLESQQKQK